MPEPQRMDPGMLEHTLTCIILVLLAGGKDCISIPKEIWDTIRLGLRDRISITIGDVTETHVLLKFKELT